jgi:rare lipoprotein A
MLRSFFGKCLSCAIAMALAGLLSSAALADATSFPFQEPATQHLPERKAPQKPKPRPIVLQKIVLLKGGGFYSADMMYHVRGAIYASDADEFYSEQGLASWYGPGFHGKRTANGEIYNMHALTAAHKTLPIPSIARVTNLDNGRTILVRINDRGPFIGDRIIDLSHASASSLGTVTSGVGRVHVEYVGVAPLNGDDARERDHLAAQDWAQPSTSELASTPPAANGRTAQMLVSVGTLTAPIVPGLAGPRPAKRLARAPLRPIPANPKTSMSQTSMQWPHSDSNRP